MSVNQFSYYFTGKEAHNLEKAVQLAQQRMHISPRGVVAMEQIHSNATVEVTSEAVAAAQESAEAKTVAETRAGAKNATGAQKNTTSPFTLHLADVDACYTRLPKVLLSVKTADCLPILISGFGVDALADENAVSQGELFPFVAAAHAGRKGTESKILYSLLEELNNKFDFVTGLKEKDQILSVWFGPAICEKCYQIDRKTDTHYSLSAKNEAQLRDFFEKYNLDWQDSLKLEVADNCTLHEPEKFYSYRQTGKGVPMNYSFVGIF